MKNRLKKITIVVMLLTFAVCGVALAKYIYENDATELVYAKEFYFTSDLLDGETHTLAADTDKVSFTLENHIDKLRYAEMDIKYKVEVYEVTDGSEKISNVVTVSYTDENGDTVSADSNNELTMPADKTTNSNITVTLSNLKSGKTYKVVAIGDGGYHKTLSATLYVQDETPTVYKSLDTSNSEYVLLTVWTIGNVGSGNVTITYPNTLAPDNTDEAMRDAKSIDKSLTDIKSFANVNVNGYTSHVYRFFGSDVGIEDFNVTYNSTDGKNITAITETE